MHKIDILNVPCCRPHLFTSNVFQYLPELEACAKLQVYCLQGDYKGVNKLRW